jgi:Holliday junction resolvase RusA-like endonuclease
LEGPIQVDIDFFLPRPKRLCRKKDPDGPVPCDAKPDRDNLDKAVLDALTALGAWKDDCQVFNGFVCKWYASKAGRTGAIIRIYPAPHWQNWKPQEP